MVQLVLDRMSIRSDRMCMVGPYEYTPTVRTVRVRSKYVYGLEHIQMEIVKLSSHDILQHKIEKWI